MNVIIKIIILADVYPTSVDTNDLIPRAHTSFIGGITLIDIGQCHGIKILLWRKRGGEQDQQQKAQHKVHKCSGKQNDKPLPLGFHVKRIRIVIILILPLHLTKTADGKSSYRVQSLTLLLFPQLGSHADGEFIYLSAKQLCRYKMSEFMDKNNQRKNNDCPDYRCYQCITSFISKRASSLAQLSHSIKSSNV